MGLPRNDLLLLNMKYEPNFNDPRVISRIRKALGFINGCFSDTKPHAWSTRYIDKYLGGQSNDLSKYLREVTLITSNHRYNKDTGDCKEYIKNNKGIQFLKDVLAKQYTGSYTSHQSINKYIRRGQMMDLVSGSTGTSLPLYPSVMEVAHEPTDQELVLEWVENEFGNELSTHNFTYDEKSNRYWHPIQRIRRKHKDVIFRKHNLPHQYDIQCCAPTLIHQQSQMMNDPMDLYLFAIRRYLKDRQQVREELSAESELPINTIKVIINALFCGAQLGMNSQSDIYQMLNGDQAKITFLKQHPFITELRKDIHTCWEYLKPAMTRISITNKAGRKQMLPIRPRQKWSLYFRLEQQVLFAVRTYLTQKGITYFLEHDGWVTNQPINEQELIDFIYNQTGFDINLDYQYLPSAKYKEEDDTGTSLPLYPSVSQVDAELFTTDKGGLTKPEHWDKQPNGSYKLNDMGLKYITK